MLSARAEIIAPGRGCSRPRLPCSARPFSNILLSYRLYGVSILLRTHGADLSPSTMASNGPLDDLTRLVAQTLRLKLTEAVENGSLSLDELTEPSLHIEGYVQNGQSAPSTSRDSRNVLQVSRFNHKFSTNENGMTQALLRAGDSPRGCAWEFQNPDSNDR